MTCRVFVRLTICLHLSCFATAAWAGPVSLSDAQRQKLIALLKSDPEAGARFAEIKKGADLALTAEPDPIQFIRSEGKLRNDPEKIKTEQSLRDFRKLHDLGFAYAVTSNETYAAKARQILVAWAKTNESRGDPIDDTSLEAPIVAYDLVRHTCSGTEKEAIDRWLRNCADAEIKSGAKKAGQIQNNWHSHRLKVVGLVGFLLEDRKLLDYVVPAFKQQVDTNLNADGSTYDFHQRDALHYHCYDLEPLITLAIVADQAGIDLYHHTAPSGASIEKSVEFLVPYCNGTKTHAEWVHSTVAFDRKRAESGDLHYQAGTLFEPRNGLNTLELAAYFEPTLDDLIISVAGSGQRYPSWRMVLNAVQKRD